MRGSSGAGVEIARDPSVTPAAGPLSIFAGRVGCGFAHGGDHNGLRRLRRACRRTPRTQSRRERTALSRARVDGPRAGRALRARDEFLRRRLAAASSRRCARSCGAAALRRVRPARPRPQRRAVRSRRVPVDAARGGHRRDRVDRGRWRADARRRPFERRDGAARRGGPASRAPRRAGRHRAGALREARRLGRGLVRRFVAARDRRAPPPRSLRVARRGARAPAREAAAAPASTPEPSKPSCTASCARTATAWRCAARASARPACYDGATALDLWPLAARIRVPVLLVLGEHSAVAPALRDRLAAAIPSLRIATIAGGTHFTALERPREVAAAIARFLAERV